MLPAKRIVCVPRIATINHRPVSTAREPIVAFAELERDAPRDAADRTRP
jgi:hypothetical protein